MVPGLVVAKPDEAAEKGALAAVQLDWDFSAEEHSVAAAVDILAAVLAEVVEASDVSPSSLAGQSLDHNEYKNSNDLDSALHNKGSA